MKNTIRILLAEDDPNLGELLSEYLEMKGFATTLARDGNAGLKLFLEQDFDLCILDVMMPKKDGFTLAKEIRMKNRSVPIIFLTAKSMKDDVLQGFLAGADDYMNKPFNMEELLMRIQAILRRTAGGQSVSDTSSSTFSVGNYQFDAHLHQLVHSAQTIKLTSKESALLELLCQNMNQPVGRSLALKLIWGDDSYFNARSMDVYVTKLRKHLNHDDRIQIMNLHGEGFKLLAP
jgi:DNA-binding response OmpR family regulator